MAATGPTKSNAVMVEVKNFINGEYRESSTSVTFQNINPCTGETVGNVHEESRDDVDAAVRAAREALHGPWGKMTSDVRSE